MIFLLTNSGKNMFFYLITTSKTFDILNKKQIVGGIQTYTRDLCLLAKEKGFNVIMYQLDDNQDDAVAEFDGFEFQIVHKSGRSNQKAFDKIYKEKNQKNSLFVIATDQMDVKSKAKNVIVIQHGVAFDCPIVTGVWSKNRYLQHINKLMRCVKNVRRLYWSCNTVCVDYNYYNWFRTLGMIYPEKRLVVIPNYSSGCISDEEFSNKVKSFKYNNIIKIVFARRFNLYRGTRIMVACIDKLLTKFPNVEFTMAGSGELKDEIAERFGNNPRVKITSFEAPDSINFHKQYDIAVVPTVFSEGTSLSLLEAMSAGCFPIATHVGGMTNIILDHYNGLLCYPDENSVYKSLVEAITMNKDEFSNIVFNAYNSSKDAFSIKLWKKRWSLLIDDIING